MKISLQVDYKRKLHQFEIYAQRKVNANKKRDIHTGELRNKAAKDAALITLLVDQKTLKNSETTGERF